MVAATAVAPAREDRRLLRRPVLRLPESLACVGAAMTLFWPGTALSSTHLVMVSSCLIPLGVRTLLRLDGVVTIPAPAGVAAEAARAAEAHRTCFEHARSGLALLDLVAVPGRCADAVVSHANRALAELAGVDVVGRRLGDLPAGTDGDLLRTALRALTAGTLTDWDGELTLGGPAGRSVRLHLVLLPRVGEGTARVSLTALPVARRRLARPLDQAPRRLPLAG